MRYSKTCVKPPLKVDKTKNLMTNDSLMKIKSIAECSPWSILQYFWPALSDNWSWKPIFGLFESGCFTQVLLWHWHSIYIQWNPWSDCSFKQFNLQSTQVCLSGFAQAWKELEFRGISWKVLENKICFEKYWKITQKTWKVLEFYYFCRTWHCW